MSDQETRFSKKTFAFNLLVCIAMLLLSVYFRLKENEYYQLKFAVALAYFIQFPIRTWYIDLHVRLSNKNKKILKEYVSGSTFAFVLYLLVGSGTSMNDYNLYLDLLWYMLLFISAAMQYKLYWFIDNGREEELKSHW